MNIEALQNEYDDTKAAARALYQRLSQQADREGRQLTSSELATVRTATERVQGLERRLSDARGSDNLQSAIERVTGAMHVGHVGANTPGGQYAPAWQAWLRENPRHRRGQRWEGPIVELLSPAGGMMAATITENPAGGGLLVPPQYLPGVLPVPLRPPVISDLLGSGTTVSNAIVYQKETAFTVAAAAVAEGAAKPESAITFQSVTDPVVKLAHWIPVTDELLEDVPAMSAYINTRLMQGVQVVEDDQLLNGTGVAPNMTGLLARAGFAAPVARVDPDTNADAIAKQIAAIQSSTYLTPTGVIVHPANWETIVLQKDSQGRYIGASPFMLPQVPSLWGKPVAITNAIAVGTALVVTQSSAMVFRRGGINVQATNSHQDFFVKHLTAIRAEERLALCVFRPSAFGLVTALK